MNLLCRQFVPIALLCSCFCHPVARGADSESKQKWWDTKLAEKPQWEPWTAQVYQSNGRHLEKAAGKMSQYKLVSIIHDQKLSGRLSVAAFVTERGGIWFGPKQSAYFETNAGVIGMTVGGSGIRWLESFVSNRAKKMSFGEVLESGHKALMAKFAEPPNQNHDPTHITDTTVLDHVVFCPTAEDELFTYFSADPGLHAVKVTDIYLNGPELRLELREAKHPDPGIPLRKYAATVWIDINSKKILKAVENGKQTLPK